MCAQILMYGIAHRGFMDTVKESALEADSGRKTPCCTGDSDLHWKCEVYCVHFTSLLNCLYVTATLSRIHDVIAACL